MPTTPHDAAAAALSQVKDDGGAADLSAEDLQQFKQELEHLARGAAHYVNDRRWAAEETRHCVWDNQSPDGRKHKVNDKDPFPFDGASDVKLRLADAIVNERVLMLSAAATRHLPRVKGLELKNEPLGHKLQTILKWVIENQLGADWFRELTKVAQYQEGDSPAVAGLGVVWKQETALEMRVVTLPQLVEAIVQMSGLGDPPQDPRQMLWYQEQRAALDARLVELDVQLQNPDRDQETAELLKELVPHVSAKRARTMVKELRASGQAEYPAPYLRVDCPAICAHRLFEDLFVPANTPNRADAARYLFVREWLSEAELRERIVSADYDEDAVEEARKHPAQTGFPLLEKGPLGDTATIGARQEAFSEAHRGLFEVITVYYRAVNDDHIPGIYYLCFHHQGEAPLHGRELLDYHHGKYPEVFFSREILNSRLLDSRGVPELVASDQNSLKLLADSRNDNVNLSTLPSYLVRRSRTKITLKLGPLEINKEDRPGDVRLMPQQAYPQGNEQEEELLRRRVDTYFGRISELVPPLLTQLHQTGMVTQFLASVREVCVMLLQLCQQYLSDETLQLITGDDGVPIARSRAEIQGKFTVELSFDPRDLDMDYLKEFIALMVQLLQMDTLNVIQRDRLLRRLFSAIDPGLAAETVSPLAAAQQSEVRDEQNNFSLIASGQEPQMVAEGQNFPLRLQVLSGIPQQNPDALRQLSPKSREIYQARLEHLQNQVQQLRNAQIGRQVGKPVLNGG